MKRVAVSAHLPTLWLKLNPKPEPTNRPEDRADYYTWATVCTDFELDVLDVILRFL